MIRSSIATVRRLSLEVIIFCVLWSPIKFEPFWVVLWLLSGDVLHIVLKDDVSGVALKFDEKIPLELRLTFKSTTSYHMKTIGIDQSLSKNAIFEHRCIKNINKLYHHAFKCDEQQQFKDII